MLCIAKVKTRASLLCPLTLFNSLPNPTVNSADFSNSWSQRISYQIHCYHLVKQLLSLEVGNCLYLFFLCLLLPSSGLLTLATEDMLGLSSSKHEIGSTHLCVNYSSQRPTRPCGNLPMLQLSFTSLRTKVLWDSFQHYRFNFVFL